MSPRTLPRLALLLSVAAAGHAAHRPLLPQPVEVRYGSERLPLCGVGVKLPGNATAEDRFAAAEFDRARAAHCGSAKPARSFISFQRTGAPDPLAMPGETAGPESRESYTLTIKGKGGQVVARSTAGLFYAAQTLSQLIEGEGAEAFLPAVVIRDWPEFAYRGTMIDTSHGPLPREDEIKRQIDFLARFKTNQFYLYSEASIELDGFPLLNPDARYSKEEIRRIIAYGRERHIDVVPFLELYGHIHDLLRLEHYSSLGTFPHGPEVDPRNPEVLKLFANWAAQFCDLFPSPFVHIGFDETWQIEMAAKKQGGTPTDLFTRQLRAVADLFQKRGKTVMAWADIVVKYPGIVEQLPPGLISVAWDYNPQPDIKRWIDPLVSQRQPHFIATGIANWYEVAVDFDTTFANIDNFLIAARKSKAMGMMNTVWLDTSYSPLRMSRPAMAYGAAAPWQATPMDRAAFFSNYATLLYPSKVAPDIAAALDAMQRAETILMKVLEKYGFNEIWESPFTEARLQRTGAHRDEFRQARLLAETAQSHLLVALAAGGDPGSLNSLLFGSRMMDYTAFRYLNAIEIAERWNLIRADFHSESYWHDFDSEVVYQSHSRLVDLMDTVTGLREMYRQLWLAEYTPYRLGTTLGRFDAEYEYWRRLQSRFRAAGQGAKTSLPELDTVTGEAAH